VDPSRADLARATVTEADLLDVGLTNAKWLVEAPVPEVRKLDARSGGLKRRALSDSGPAETN
jgi:hypothetical protein